MNNKAPNTSASRCQGFPVLSLLLRGSTNSFLGQERPGVLKLGPISIGVAADGQ